MAVAVACAAACDRAPERSEDDGARSASGDVASAAAVAAAAPEGGLVKIVLQPEDATGSSAEPIELLLEIDPPVASDGWVESLASEVNAGLRACDATGQALEIDVVLEVSGSAIRGGEGEGALAACLIGELSGAEIARLDDTPRRLRLRVGDLVP